MLFSLAVGLVDKVYGAARLFYAPTKSIVPSALSAFILYAHFTFRSTFRCGSDLVPPYEFRRETKPIRVVQQVCC